MLKTLVLVLGAIAFLFLAPTQALAAQSLRLEASLSAPSITMKGHARYEEIQKGSRLQQRFKVEIQNVKPGSSFIVSVSGKQVAKITANAFGRAEIELRVNGDDVRKAVPSLPRMKPGDVVTVGPTSGALR